jgi:cell wall-associated NlpC family hydrolase
MPTGHALLRLLSVALAFSLALGSLASCVPKGSALQARELARFVNSPKHHAHPAQKRARSAVARHAALTEALDTEQVYVDMLAELELGLSANLAPGAVAEAVRPYLGVPYLWGGETHNGLDCSGFTRLVYRSLGISLPRTSREQAKVGMPVSKDSLQVGDLVFYSVESENIDHVGIVVGPNHLAHATNKRGRVVVEPISRIYPGSFVAARRVASNGHRD